MRIDFELDGMQSLREDLRDLEERYGEASARVVNSGAEYSVQLEYGRGPIEAKSADALRFENDDGEVIYRTSVSGHPPYPFFYPAVREFQAAPEAFILRNSGLDSLEALQSTDDLVEAIASALQSQMRANANANRSGRSPGTHPEHPEVQTGNLVAQIQVFEV